MLTRLAGVGAVAGLLLTGLAVVAPSANAAWTVWGSTHGTKAQVCKQSLSGDRWRIDLRVDNRGASHAHRVSMFRDRDGDTREVSVRAAAGRVSGVVSLVWARGDEGGVTVHEPNGNAAGDMLRLSMVTRC